MPNTPPWKGNNTPPGQGGNTAPWKGSNSNSPFGKGNTTPWKGNNSPRGGATGKPVSWQSSKPTTKKIRQKISRSNVSKIRRPLKGVRKPPRAGNISKFGGGKAKQIKQVSSGIAAVAAKTGTTGLPLVKLLANSRFLAGVNSVPAVALIGANIAVWRQNLQTLLNIYRPASSPAIFFYDPSAASRVPEPPFTGGQSQGVLYKVLVTVERYDSRGTKVNDTTVLFDNVIGKVQGAKVELKDEALGSFSLALIGTNYDGTDQLLGTSLGVGFSSISVSKLFISRKDGLSDTGGDPPAIGETQVSQGGVSNSNGQSPTPKSPPSSNKKLKTYSDEIIENDSGSTPTPKVQAVPAQISIPAPNPQDNTTTEPHSPTDSPPVVQKDPTTPAINNKPKTYVKKTYYPQNSDFKLPGTEIIPNSTTGIPTRITRRYADPKIPDNAEEITTVIPVVLAPIKPVPKVVTKYPASVTPAKVTRINPCKKGCGGASSNNGSNLTPAESNALLQLGDLALLQTINQKLGDKIPNGGISGGLKNLHKSLAFDRWLNLLNVALTLNNALILSSSVLDTVIQVADNVFNAIGFKFKSPDGSEIGFGSVVSGGVKSILSKIIPKEVSQASQNVFVKFNRVVQVGGNLLQNVRSMMDSTQDIAETTGENVAVIGNALRKTGVVRENSYSPMPEQFDHNSRIHRRLEQIADTVDIFEDITSDLQDIGDETREMKENYDEYQDLLKKERDQKVRENKDIKQAVTNTPEPTEEDEVRGVDKDA